MENSHFDFLLTGSHPLSLVAEAYFPGYSRPQEATKKFRKEVTNNPRLHTELQEKGYNSKTYTLLPVYIRIIITCWGMPDEARIKVKAHPHLRETKLNRHKHFDEETDR